MFSDSKYSWIDFESEVPDALKDIPVQVNNKSISRKDFNLALPVSNNWNDKANRLLIIIEEVATADLKSKFLCGGSYGDDLYSTLELARNYAKLHADISLNQFGISVINFNAFKSYDLPNTLKGLAHKAFKTRIRKFIKTMNPTHILCMGDTVSKMLIPGFSANTRGWVHTADIAGKEVFIGSTLDISLITSASSFTDEDDEDSGDERDMYTSAGLIEITARYIANLFLKGHVDDPHGLPYSIHNLKPTYKLITTIKEFDKLMSLLKKAECFALDTETRNLNRQENDLLIMQFAVDSKVGYIVPYKHKDSPFNEKELKYIRDEVVALLSDLDRNPILSDKYMIGTNLQFDIVQLKVQLSTPIITIPTFDIQNGEYIYDENIKGLSAFGDPKAYSLASIALRFGCTLYLNKEGFNKQDRENMASTSLEDESLLEYCGYDVTVPFAIHELQLRRAQLEKYSKYKKMVILQQGTNQHVCASLESRGLYIDTKYLEGELQPNSDLNLLIQDTQNKWLETDGAKEANRQILDTMGVPKNSLFDDGNETQVFTPGKSEHLQVLFNDVLHLEPVGGYQKKERHNGELAMSLGKAFQSAHRFIPEVKFFTEINQLKKLKSSYVVAFLNSIKNTDDGKLDGRIRPGFGYLLVVTGRSNSFKPSLQQTPTRGKSAKIIKRAFVAPQGRIRMETDYSANEVRFATNISRDEVMAEPFNVARSLRKKYYKADCREVRLLREAKLRGIEVPQEFKEIKGIQDKPVPSKNVKNLSDEEVLKELAVCNQLKSFLKTSLKTKGDIHIANIHRFFNVWVDKSHPLRYAIKGIVFGVIYGKGPRTLAKDLFQEDVKNAENALYDAKVKASKGEISQKELKAAQTKLDEVQESFDSHFTTAKDIMTKMSLEWEDLYSWMDRMHDDAESKGFVEAPHGRRRHLKSMLFSSKKMKAAFLRRAVNAPVQGFSSDIAFMAARLIEWHMAKYLKIFHPDYLDSYYIEGGVECAVHDALYQCPKYEVFLATLHIMQWCMTTGVTNTYAELFNHHWLTPPEVETGIGFSAAHTEAWDYSYKSLRDAVRLCIKEQYENGFGQKGVTEKEAFDKVFKISKEEKKYLQSNYPFFDNPEHLTNLE